MRIVWILLLMGVSIGSADCGGDSTTAKQRVARCMKTAHNLQVGAAAPFLTTDLDKRICEAAERDGYLHNNGRMSREDSATEVRRALPLVKDACANSYAVQARSWKFDEAYLPTGGTQALAAKLCDHLEVRQFSGRHMMGVTMSSRFLRPFAVQLCTATGVTLVAERSGKTSSTWDKADHLSRSDWVKLWETGCGRAFDKGLFTGTGRLSSSERAEFQRIIEKTFREMVRSGELTPVS